MVCISFFFVIIVGVRKGSRTSSSIQQIKYVLFLVYKANVTCDTEKWFKSLEVTPRPLFPKVYSNPQDQDRVTSTMAWQRSAYETPMGAIQLSKLLYVVC